MMSIRETCEKVAPANRSWGWLVSPRERGARLAVRKAFTLIEMLVVISIILLLAGILLPTIDAAARKMDRRRAEVECRAIVSAVRAFYNDYRYYPVVKSLGVADQTVPVSGTIFKALTGQDRSMNPNNTPYLEASKQQMDKGSFEDPWGRDYKVVVDLNMDGQVSMDGNIMSTKVAAMSEGDTSDPRNKPIYSWGDAQ